MLISIILILVIILYVIFTYNRIINEKNKVDNQFSQIDVQLKRRADLIPNLVEVVKGYAKHERKVFKEVIETRNNALYASSISEKAEANNSMVKAVNNLIAISENYPELKTNENYMKLQSDLVEIEDKICYSRQFYNDSVMSYNNRISLFPANIIAKVFKFQKCEYFRTNDREAEKIKL